jgi:3-methyl-2-oxobutanoate hydroxymethyltransferase
MSSHAIRDTARKPVTLTALQEMHRASIPISMLTCYDASFAEAMDAAGVDCILVGDSLGMVVQGHASTLPVSLQEMVYHTQCVARRCAAAWLMADLPFGSYGESIAQAVHSASELMKAGAKMVKIEGGGWTAPVVRALTERGIPVCAHLGLTPQSVHALGGFRVQGRTRQQAALLVEQTRELHEAGAAMIVLELMPTEIAQQVQQAVPGIITIGIGAGHLTSGQVLVMHDMLGVTSGKMPKFVRNFMAGADSIQAAFKLYAGSVRDRSFPDPALHGYELAAAAPPPLPAK